MQKAIASSIGIRRAFVGLVAAWVVSTAGATPAAAEVVCEGNVNLYTQAEVDNFSCTVVTGNLTVSGAGITNLDGLSSLTSVGGSLAVGFNPLLTDLDGLSSLTSVGAYLAVGFNPLLTDLDGLSSLTSVGGGLYVYGNPSLTDVDGLSSLTSVGGGLYVTGNDSLTNLDGLSSLTSVGDYLSVTGNDTLTEFCGLYPLVAAGGLVGSYNVFGNAANPSAADILAAGPCDPADTITKLFDEGAINRGQAEALLRLADHSLMGLGNTLDAFVRAGFLTESEANLLFVIASNW